MVSKKAKDKVREAKRERQELKAAKKCCKDSAATNLLELLAAAGAEEETAGAAAAAPPPRTSFTFLNTKNGFVIFGGELYDTKTCKVFNDCYKWTPERKEEPWKRATGRVPIKPRVGHASCLFNDEVYVHGGEFATTSQFYHFRDLWKLDTKTLTWTEVTAAGGPSSRSGHRVTVCRNMLLLFGGFHDNGKEVRYFNDLHSFSPSVCAWKKLNPVGGRAPSVRSASVVGVANDQLVVSGGFSKTRDTDRDCKGTFHDDIWSLDLRPLFEPELKDQELCWVKSKKRALTRAGLAYCQHKNLVYTFGGVVDNDAGGNSYNSSFFFNDVWAFELVSKTWSRLKTDDCAANAASVPAYRPVRRHHLEKVLLDTDQMRKLVSEAEAARNNSKTKERSGTTETVKLSDAGVTEKFEDYKLLYDVPTTSLSEPLPRCNSACAVSDGYLYVYGGSLELGKSQMIIFDDAWRLHLKTLEWECVHAGTYVSRIPEADPEDDDSSTEGSSCSTEGSDSEDTGSDEEEPPETEAED